MFEWSERWIALIVNGVATCLDSTVVDFRLLKTSTSTLTNSSSPLDQSKCSRHSNPEILFDVFTETLEVEIDRVDLIYMWHSIGSLGLRVPISVQIVVQTSFILLEFWPLFDFWGSEAEEDGYAAAPDAS